MFFGRAFHVLVGRSTVKHLSDLEAQSNDQLLGALPIGVVFPGSGVTDRDGPWQTERSPEISVPFFAPS